MFTSKLKLSNFIFSSSNQINLNSFKYLIGLYPLQKFPIFGNSSSFYSSLISIRKIDDVDKDNGEFSEYPFQKSLKCDDFCLESRTSDRADKVYERITNCPFPKSSNFVESTYSGDEKSPNLISYEEITECPFPESSKFVQSSYSGDEKSRNLISHEEITEFPVGETRTSEDCCAGANCMIDEASDSSGINTDADKIYKVISEPSNHSNLEKALDEVAVQLTTSLVVEVLHRFRYEEKIAFRFFTWAGNQEFYSHEPQVYNEIIDILSSTKYKVKQFGIVCDLLDYMKRNEKKKSVPVEVLLSILRKYTEKHLTHLRKFAKKKRINLKLSPEIDAFNLLLDALCKCCLVEDAETMFSKVQNKVKPNVHTYNIMFFGWCRVRNPKKAMLLLEDMIKMGFTPESFTYNTAIDTFCREGMVTEAIELLEFMKDKGSKMSSPTAKTYSVVIVALAQNNRLDECFKYIEHMISSGCLPDVSTYKELIEGMCCAGKIEAAYKLLEAMGNKGYPPDVVTYNCFLKVLCDQKNGDEAMKLYKRMIELSCKPSVHTFNMMISMFFEMGDPDGAFDTWHEMEKRGCARDTSTYCLMIDGLFGCGRAQSACFLLEDVLKYEMKLPYEKFNLFLQKLAEIGDLQAIHKLSEHSRKFYNPVMARRFTLSQKRRSMSLRGK